MLSAQSLTPDAFWVADAAFQNVIKKRRAIGCGEKPARFLREAPSIAHKSKPAEAVCGRCG